jgi:hypothetical protein
MLTLIVCHNLAAPAVRAQGVPVPQAAPSAEASPAQAPKKIYSNQTRFRLPVGIDDRDRPLLQSVQLFVRALPGDWQQKDSAPPAQKHFLYDVHQDGEYWFSVVAIDNAGRANPADVRLEPPQLIVVVDTQPPDIEVRTEGGPGSETLLRCTIKDANPDYSSLKISYRGADQAWHDLEPLPGNNGIFRVPGNQVLSGTIRVSASDLARNVTNREVTLQAPPSQHAGANGANPAVSQPRSPEPIAIESSSAVPLPPTVKSAPDVTPVPHAGTPAGPALPPADGPAARPSSAGGVERTAYSTGPTQGASSPSRQLLNTTRASLDYRLDQIGPSGVSRVEIWITNDEGKNWQRLCEDPDRRSPALLNLPGEGLFGLRLVVTNGNGFGGTPPAKGDQPTCWIEVDTTPPHAHLQDIEPVVKEGALEIRWTATDKNLGPEPVSLFYATTKEGPWLPIAHRLRNDGLYRWNFPREAGAQFFLRMDVTDQVGNTARCELANPVTLDMTEPRAQVVGVTGVTARPPQ